MWNESWHVNDFPKFRDFSCFWLQSDVDISKRKRMRRLQTALNSSFRMKFNWREFLITTFTLFSSIIDYRQHFRFDRFISIIIFCWINWKYGDLHSLTFTINLLNSNNIIIEKTASKIYLLFSQTVLFWFWILEYSFKFFLIIKRHKKTLENNENQ